MRTTVDSSTTSAVAVCECGARFLAVSYGQALRRAVQHEEVAHVDEHHARDLFRKWEKRSQRRRSLRSGAGSKHGNPDRVQARE